MRRVSILLLIVALQAATVYAGMDPGKGPVDGIVAVVNGMPITLYQVRQRLQILKQGPKTVTVTDQHALDELIDDDIVYGELKSIGVMIGAKEVDSAVEQMAESNGISLGSLKADLKSKGIDFDAYREEIKSELARSKLVGYKFRTEITVTEDDLQRYYIEHRKEFSQVRQADVSHILIEVPPDSSDRRKKDLLKKAGSVMAKLVSGEGFSKVAERYSDDRLTRKAGGELGYVEQGTLYPVVDRAIFSAVPGRLIGPLRTPVGYEIIKVNGFKSSELLPLKDVKDKIRSLLYTRKLEAALKGWLLTKRRKAIITIYNELL